MASTGELIKINSVQERPLAASNPQVEGVVFLGACYAWHEPTAYACPLPALFNTEVPLACRNGLSLVPSKFHKPKKKLLVKTERKLLVSNFSVLRKVLAISFQYLHGCHAEKQQRSRRVSRLRAFLVALLVHTPLFFVQLKMQEAHSLSLSCSP